MSAVAVKVVDQLAVHKRGIGESAMLELGRRSADASVNYVGVDAFALGAVVAVCGKVSVSVANARPQLIGAGSSTQPWSA